MNRDRKEIEDRITKFLKEQPRDLEVSTYLSILQTELLLDIRDLLQQANEKQGITRGDLWSSIAKDSSQKDDKCPRKS